MSKARKKTTIDKPTVVTNEYEKRRLLTIEANNSMLESLNLKRIRAPSLMDSFKKTKTTSKQRTFDGDNDIDYEPNFDEGDLEEQCKQGEELENTTKKNKVVLKEGRKKNKFIAPLSLARVLTMNEKQRREIIGDDAAKSVSSAMKALEEAISRKEPDVDVGGDIDFDDFTNEEFNQFTSNMGRGTCGDISNTDEEHQTEEENRKDPEEHDGNDSNEDDVSVTEVERPLDGNKELIIVGSESNIPGKVRKTRGPVYCRKLTTLAPGEKIFVEFNEDGIPIGDNGSIFSYFLGEQVRNRAVCPVQVRGWKDFKIDTLDRLWSCVTEKCEFDNPDLRKEAVLKHARSLFRNGRYKLRLKYIITPNLTTKEEQLRNKPKEMLKADWKYLIDLWWTPKFQDRSKTAKESRSCQKMPHYTGSKSHARVKEELKKKNGRDCSRVDLLLETRKRKSKKIVNSTNLACNMQAIDEVNKLKKDRDEGLNQKTDEEILTEVLGKDTKGYLRCYGRGKSLTQYFGVKPSRLNLATEVMQVQKKTEDIVNEAKEEVDKARKEAEDAKKEAEAARKDAEAAKKKAEATESQVDAKIEANNKLWEKKMLGFLKSFGIGTSDH